MGSKEQIGRNCPYCGAVIIVDEYFCRACHKRLLDQQDFSAPSTVKAETYIVAVRNPFIAGILAFVSPGLGQFYNAETLKGLVFFLAFIAISFDMIAVDILTRFHAVFFLGIWALGIIDAVYSARQINCFAQAVYNRGELVPVHPARALRADRGTSPLYRAAGYPVPGKTVPGGRAVDGVSPGTKNKKKI